MASKTVVIDGQEFGPVPEEETAIRLVGYNTATVDRRADYLKEAVGRDEVDEMHRKDDGEAEGDEEGRASPPTCLLAALPLDPLGLSA